MSQGCHSQPLGGLIARCFLGALCVFVVSSFLFFYRLADRDLWSSHEARAAQDAQTILDDGRWGLPRLFHGEIELQKPPLYYWTVAALSWCRGGVDAWTVRLPAALSALACVLCLCGFGQIQGRPLAGLLAAVVLATAQHFTWLARVGRIDMPLTLTVTVAVLGCRLALTGSGRWPLLPSYLALAAGALLKGPIAVVLPVAVIGVHLLVEREVTPWRWRQWLRLGSRLGLWWGVPLTAALALPWFLWANAQTQGELFRVFFWHHNVERGFDGAGGLKEHPWWFYGPQFAFDFLPWSPLLPVAGWLLRRHGGWRQDTEARFGAVWLLTILVVLSCARFKRADYLLPAFPEAALFLGCAAERWLRERQLLRAPCFVLSPVRAIAAAVLLVIMASWWVHLDIRLPAQEPHRDYRRFATEIRRRSPAPQHVLLFWTESHPLAFHLGRPLDILIEWDDLDAWAARPETTYVVMPPEVARRWPEFLAHGRLEPVLSNTELAGGTHEKPLLLLRTVSNARASRAAPDCDCPDQRLAPGTQRETASAARADELGDAAGVVGQ
jgi:4-amino-4-deoxy-L-arabinose transferase-like glycosyltransferase